MAQPLLLPHHTLLHLLLRLLLHLSLLSLAALHSAQLYHAVGSQLKLMYGDWKLAGAWLGWQAVQTWQLCWLHVGDLPP